MRETGYVLPAVVIVFEDVAPNVIGPVNVELVVNAAIELVNTKFPNIENTQVSELKFPAKVEVPPLEKSMVPYLRRLGKKILSTPAVI